MTAGLAIAMGKGQPATKAAADFVTDSNEEDGFAHAIERIILGGERSSVARKPSRDQARS
jgi:hydroxymethylpyrimidine pyrophosphatase-like HAD family hydrolase